MIQGAEVRKSKTTSEEGRREGEEKRREEKRREKRQSSSSRRQNIKPVKRWSWQLEEEGSSWQLAAVMACDSEHHGLL
jgi:hypothetical protein